MTQKINFVITNNGDGSNSADWVTDEAVLNKMEELADDGDASYTSGDGLQVTTLYFPDSFDLEGWIKLNRLNITTYEDVDREAYYE